MNCIGGTGIRLMLDYSYNATHLREFRIFLLLTDRAGVIGYIATHVAMEHRATNKSRPMQGQIHRLVEWSTMQCLLK